MGILSARSTTYIFKYMGLDTLIVSIALLLLLLIIWVLLIYERGMEIKRAGDFIVTKKILLLK